MAIPIRVLICVMIFFTTYINYTARVNLSVSIVSMVKKKAGKKPDCMDEAAFNKTLGSGKDQGNRYDWSQQLQGYIIGSYFAGYVATSLPAGWFADYVGPYRSILWSNMATVVLNVLCVFGTWGHFSLLLILRFLIGAAAGLIYPALQCLIARWAPPAEKGKFVSALMGNTLGTCVTFPVVGAITDRAGWEMGFYFVSAQMAVYCIIFMIMTADSPEQHRWITKEEVEYIHAAQGGAVNKKKAVPPYVAMFTSIPFWALCILHIGNLWGLYLQMTGVPKFMSEVLGFKLKEAGFLAALPHLMRLFAGFAFGAIGDFLKKKEVNPKFTRKFFVLFSHILPGLSLVLLKFIMTCNEAPIVALLVVSMALNGAVVLTNLLNSQDLSPNFAGTIFGIISFVGGLTGFLTPVITAALTEEKNGMKEWGWNFIIGGSVYISCGVVFIFFGSVEKQPWNEKKEENTE